MIVAKHVHVATSARPDRVMATGVIQPYPLYADPRSIARKTIEAFTSWASKEVAQANPAMSPADIAARARDLAMRGLGGYHVATRTDPRLAAAAHYLVTGQPFVVRSGGKAAVVKSTGPAYAFVDAHPVNFGVK